MDNLKLKLLTMDDANNIFTSIDSSREHIGKWLPWVKTTKSVDDIIVFVNSVLKAYENKTEYHWGIWYNHIFVGLTSFHTINYEEKWGEIGYWIREDYSNRGFITNSSKILLEYGFKNLNLEEIRIQVNPKNIKSEKVALKLNFNYVCDVETKVEKLKRYVLKKEDWVKF